MNTGSASILDSTDAPPILTGLAIILASKALKVNEWQCNMKPVQDISSPYCGQHVCFFSVYICIGYSMSDIINMYTNDLKTNNMLGKKFVHDLLA